jgi:hypothetical protein
MYEELNKLCFECGKGRHYIVRHRKNNIDEIKENEYKVVYEDEPEWDGSGVLMVILDGKEPITLEMLKQKRIELEQNPPPAPPPTLEEENKQLKEMLDDIKKRLLTLELTMGQ